MITPRPENPPAPPAVALDTGVSPAGKPAPSPQSPQSPNPPMSQVSFQSCAPYPSDKPASSQDSSLLEAAASKAGGDAAQCLAGAPARARPARTLRLYISATDLHEVGPARRGACAIVYLRESGALRMQLSNVTASSEDGSPQRRRPPSRRPPSARARELRTLVGQTEIARVRGRDVEFARTFMVPLDVPSAQVVHIDIYSCDPRDPARNWLLGVAEIPLAQLYAARGYKTAAPIAFVPSAEKERKRRGNAGVFQLVVEDVSPGLAEYRLDVQCGQMKRAKAWSSGRVRRAHYAIHTIASRDEQCEDWVLLFRSDPVEMVKKKRDGGSLEYNYFSSRPLMAAPGIIVADTDDKEGADSVLHKVAHKIKNRNSGLFFSLPSGAISCVSPERRLKLSIYDDSSHGFDLIADTQFTVAELRAMNLGDSTEVQVNSNPVGYAALKFVECGDDPNYFCLSIYMPHLK